MPLWPSPISTTDVASSGLRLAWPSVVGDEVWWTEDRPDEGGRTTIVHRAADGTRTSLLPAPWNARSRVHEYGGQPYLVTPRGVVFVNFDDQRLYLATSGEPTPLTPDDGSRYADLHLGEGHLWCVRERHDGKVTRSIVSVPLEGANHANW